MKLKIIDSENKVIGEKDLPSQFNEILRPDLIKRAVHALQANRRQPYGASEDAGKRHSAYLSKRRRAYRGTYGIGQSRTPRKVMTRRGTRFFYVGAFAPQTVGGRRAHPPKAEKIWKKKINKKEKKKAIRSAIAATIVQEVVKARGHLFPDNYPFIIESKIEQINKTKNLKIILKKIGLKEELTRTKKKKVRAGKGKLRGRKYKKKIGPLLVVSKECNLLKSGKNIPGVDVVKVQNLNAEVLAPGAKPGRLTLWSKDAIELLEKKNLFY